MSKNRTSTRKLELVETGNIALALQRLLNVTDRQAHARALLHALQMTYALDGDIRKQIVHILADHL